MEAIKAYLKEIRHIPLLNAKQEKELAMRVKNGEEAARKLMIKSNLRLVISIAKRYMNFGLPFMDLIEEGNMGLMKAVDRFNPRKGYRFSTYAAWWIKQSISRALSEQSRLIRTPVYMTELIGKWKKTNERLSQKLTRAPYPREIARAMHLPVARVQQIQQWISSTSSLESPIGEDGESQVKDLMEDEHAVAPDAEITHFFEHERLANLLEMMNERERRVLDLRFGLVDGESKTLAEVALQLGVSRERVRQIEETALQKLRRFISEHKRELL